eukprot:5760031-Prorocentrum_lima.AAC.1
MTSSLVGSEMCIRDRQLGQHQHQLQQQPQSQAGSDDGHDNKLGDDDPEAVSYTHLTLPTICSV